MRVSAQDILKRHSHAVRVRCLVIRTPMNWLIHELGAAREGEGEGACHFTLRSRTHGPLAGNPAVTLKPQANCAHALCLPATIDMPRRGTDMREPQRRQSKPVSRVAEHPNCIIIQILRVYVELTRLRV